jgi:GDPmannose 4,6-dehydratase
MLKKSRPKRALILGISGQDGAYLARLLLRKGYQVHGSSRDVAVSRFESLKRMGLYADLHLHSAVLHDFRSVAQTLRVAKPDEVYNLAGQSSVGLSFSQPVETMESIATASLNLVEALRMFAPGVRLYNAGSSECFGNTGPVKASENTPFQPVSPYGVAKAAAFYTTATYRRAYGLFACSGILYNHESPLRPERYVTRKVTAAAARIAQGSKEKLVLGDLSIERDWGWAEEYVEAMWAMLQQKRPDDFVVATGVRASLRSFVEAAFAAFKLDYRRHVRQEKSLYRPSEIRSNAGDPAKAARVLGWKARLKMPALAGQLARLEAPGLR